MPEEPKPVAGPERVVKLLGIYTRLVGAEIKKLEACWTRLEEIKEEIDALLDGTDYAKSYFASSIESLTEGCEELAETFIKLDDLYAEREAKRLGLEEAEAEFAEIDNEETNGFAEAEVETEESEETDETTESILTEDDVGAVVGP